MNKKTGRACSLHVRMYKLNICTRPSFSYVSFLQPLVAEWGVSVHLVGLLKVCTSSWVLHRCVPNMCGFFSPFTYGTFGRAGTRGMRKQATAASAQLFLNQKRMQCHVVFALHFSSSLHGRIHSSVVCRSSRFGEACSDAILGTHRGGGGAPKICTTSGHRCFPSVRFKVAGKKKEE